jgi:hypothetical protein
MRARQTVLERLEGADRAAVLDPLAGVRDGLDQHVPADADELSA